MFIFICISTPSIIFNFYLDNGSSRHRNVDNFIALTFITKDEILRYIIIFIIIIILLLLLLLLLSLFLLLLLLLSLLSFLLLLLF